MSLDEFPTAVNWHNVQPREIATDCPHCGRAQHVEARYVWLIRDAQDVRYANLLEPDATLHQLRHYECASCSAPVAHIETLGIATDQTTGRRYGYTLTSTQVWPRSAALPRDISALPPELQRDAREALEVAPVSGRASAALARRFIQHFLVAVVGAPSNVTLFEQINWALDNGHLPPALRDQLHAVRRLGNHGAHANSDAHGVLVDVEPDEVAVLGLVIEGLATYYATNQALSEGVAAIHARLDASRPDDPSAGSQQATT